MFCTNCGATIPDDSIVCPSCGTTTTNSQPQMQPQQMQPQYSDGNTFNAGPSPKKGMGSISEGAFFNPSAVGPFPSNNDPDLINSSQIKKLNWGAFWFNWIWLGNNAGWIWGIIFFLLGYFTGGITNFILSIFLLFEGNKIAWKFRSFSSIEEFEAVQGAWRKWFLILLILTLVLCVIAFFMLGTSLLK